MTARYPEFEGRVAVVTGAASGIGAAVAAEFLASGARVALLDRDADGLRTRMAELQRDALERTLGVVTDVGRLDSIERAVAGTLDVFGELHYVVNCAASFVAAGLDATTADWELSLGVNVRGAAQVVATCASHLPDGGAVVNTASISAHVAQPDRWTYNATKAAIVAMTRCQALDLADRGVRVNCVSPGWIWTPEVLRAAGGDRHRYEAEWGGFHMLRRLGEPAEVARAVLFLCSSDASFITGTELMVDGGYHGMSAEGHGDRSQFAGTD